MSVRAQVAVVVVGYGIAVAAGVLAGRVYDASVSALPYDTSGGMYAGGEAITSLGTFLIVSLVPTLLALWFLRHNEKLWNAIAVASIAFAAAGLAAVLMPLVTRPAGASVGLALLALLGLVQLLGVPLWSLAFAGFAFLAPTRPVATQAAGCGRDRAGDRSVRGSALVRAGAPALERRIPRLPRLPVRPSERPGRPFGLFRRLTSG